MDTKKLRQKILDLAIRGKLVPQDPNDEPASVLLERIKAEKERLIKEGKIKRSKKTNNASDTPHYENVPFEVPDNWAWTTLGEICLFLSRGKSPKYSDSDKTYPVFAQKCNLKEGGISLEQARFLDPSTICKWSEEYKLKTGDVLVNSTGTGTVGRTRLFHESYLKHYPFVVPDSHVSVIRTASEIKSEFVFAYISSKLIQEYLEDNLAGSTNQKELYIGVLSDLSFPLPPLAEQQRIVTEIEKWFSLIDQIEQGKDDLHSIVKQTKSKILDLAIHGELVPQDPNDEPAIELLKRINPSFTPCDNGHYPQLPDGWCKCRLEDIVEYEQPQAYIVNSTDYDDRYLTPVLTAGKSFVIGYTNETEGIYQNTPCIIFDDFTTDSKLVDFPFKVKSSAMKILKVADDIEIEYVAMFMNITRLIGDTHKRYWISEYSKLCIPIPPKEEQKRIINAANAMFEKLDAIIESL
ncbi:MULTISPECIES: restriction endonuclease subunit S [Bacteroidales]|jgi:type I restriction enzyme S subunit|uniref:restriction endonuclease subunit S n=1 Tax=Bacteroidales TaxID=171549 RepID=UPI0032EDB548